MRPVLTIVLVQFQGRTSLHVLGGRSPHPLSCPAPDQPMPADGGSPAPHPVSPRGPGADRRRLVPRPDPAAGSGGRTSTLAPRPVRPGPRDGRHPGPSATPADRPVPTRPAGRLPRAGGMERVSDKSMPTARSRFSRSFFSERARPERRSSSQVVVLRTTMATGEVSRTGDREGVVAWQSPIRPDYCISSSSRPSCGIGSG